MDSRSQFARTTLELLDARPDLALVYAEITGQHFGDAHARHPKRTINVGIREQLLVSAAAGLSLVGLRPIVHTFSSFLIERAFEQIKLDFVHQDVGGILVGYGGSYDISGGGRTHQCPADVALLDTLPGITITAPGSEREVDEALRLAASDDGLHYIRVSAATNSIELPLSPEVQVVRAGAGPVVLAIGPILDEVLPATSDLGVTVLYANTVRPLDTAGLLAALGSASEVVLVEPWLEGTSAAVVSAALSRRPHRLLSIGVPRPELRRYGTPTEHARAHGLDAAGIRRRIVDWLAP